MIILIVLLTVEVGLPLVFNGHAEGRDLKYPVVAKELSRMRCPAPNLESAPLKKHSWLIASSDLNNCAHSTI